ncbi:cation diffusion facilitator family transporter [Psychroflexus planctonicus]|uniref:cation diffusion facilitator family transporter n=1 Tax=Psychroflexus planctonicus TaxID=1526575 RepID=UPI00166DB86A|nr:cation diffusion facilitator family transporter [Psychroflexus planctonicus]
MSHAHTAYKSKQKNLLIAIVLNVLITVAQVIGGIISGSLALLSDALHNFSDVVSLLISYVASFFSNKKASQNKTFGYKRAEIIAAFINACTLIVIAFFLIIEATERFFKPEIIDATLVIWLSIVAIVGNGISVWILHADAKNNMNIRSSYLHLFTDLLGSVAVLIGGLLMQYYQLYWVDGVLTLMIAIYLLIVGFQLAKKAFGILMLFTPKDINVKQLVNQVNSLPEVKHMHHVHIWQLNDDEVHLEAHIDFDEDIALSKFDAILEQIETIAVNQYGINHINIQPEYQKPDNKNVIVQD